MAEKTSEQMMFAAAVRVAESVDCAEPDFMVERALDSYRHWRDQVEAERAARVA